MSSKEKEHARRALPKWITAHFEDALNAHQNLTHIVHISEKGIGVLRGMPKVIKILSDINGSEDSAMAEQRVQTAEREAELAKTEIENGFPVLHGFAVVALWSWLENFVKDLVSLWLLHRRSALQAQQIQKLKVRLGDYLQLQKAEQASYLVELLEKDLASSLKRGANRFESLLEPIGLSGELPADCGKTLFELQQIRNVVAHRNGRADRKLRTECPWLKCRANSPLQISRIMLKGYSEASVQYLLEVLYRVGDVYDLDLRGRGQQEVTALEARKK